MVVKYFKPDATGIAHKCTSGATMYIVQCTSVQCTSGTTNVLAVH